VGRDKGSLTEQQTKGTVTTTIQKKGNIQNKPAEQSPQNRTALSDCTTAEPSRAASEFPPRRPPSTGTQHDGTWYGIPGSVWPGWGWVSPPGCAPSWILVKINPVLAKPGTPTYKSSSCKIFGSLAGQFITFYVWLHHCHQLQNDCLLNISAKTLP